MRHGSARPRMGDPSSHAQQRITTRHGPCHGIDNSSQLSTPGRPVGFLGGITGHQINDILVLSMRGRPVGLKKAASLLVKQHMKDPAP